MFARALLRRGGLGAAAGVSAPRLFRTDALSAGLNHAVASGLFTPPQVGRDDEQRASAMRTNRLPLVQFRGFASDAITTHVVDGVIATDAVEVARKNPSDRPDYNQVNHQRFAPGDPSKRAFTYLVMTGGRFIYASALRLLALKFILSMTASKDVLAMASLEVDLSAIEVGNTVTVKWRGKPVFIRHRTAAEIKKVDEVDIKALRDPQTDASRCIEPEWLVVVGVCTHLGCVPLPNAGDYGGWFCPCHGSHYDVSGRIRKGPAPYNLEVPEYKFLEESKLLVG